MKKPRLTRDQKQMALRLKSMGMASVEIGRQLGFHHSLVDVMFAQERFTKGVVDEWTPRSGHLSICEREEILLGLTRGVSMSAIAQGLGRSPSTITREVTANGG